MEKISRKAIFLGVLACDQLPETLVQNDLPAVAIINTHNSRQPGEHWVATYIAACGTVCFFDSFGNNPDSDIFPSTIYTFLKNSGSPVLFSKIQVQDFLSVTCGEHCVFFLYHMLKGLSYDDVMLKYSENLIKNNNMVSLFVKKLRPHSCMCNVFTCVQHAQTNNCLHKC